MPNGEKVGKRKKFIIIVSLSICLIVSGWIAARRILAPWIIRQLIESSMMTKDEYHISQGLVIGKSSATTYFLYNSAGDGLISGEIQDIYYNQKKRLIIVSYIPLGATGQPSQQSSHLSSKEDLSYAYGKINSSGEVINDTMIMIEKNSDNELLIEGGRYPLNILTPIERWYHRRI